MKIAIVTGASSGMGKEFTRQIERLYKNLDEIWVIARRKERLDELKSRMMTHVRVFNGDLLENEIYETLAKAMEDQKPDIRMLVNAAGFVKTGEVAEIDCVDQLDMVDVTCKALTHMTKICIPYMSKGSRILNLASAAAFCPQPEFSVYAETKSYVLSFSRSLRTELQDAGIIVTAVCPGPVETEFFEVSGGKPESNVKNAVMADPGKVVRQALLDAVNEKEMSVYGLPMKSAAVATKIIPHSWILKLMKKFW